MPSTINTAFTLLVIGMTTVFFILSLVVGSGKVLTLIVNRYFSSQMAAKSTIFEDSSMISRKKIAVITAAIDLATNGEGYVVDIKKIENG
jgi:oxaloacetate decarboxylase gamma subunit